MMAVASKLCNILSVVLVHMQDTKKPFVTTIKIHPVNFRLRTVDGSERTIQWQRFSLNLDFISYSTVIMLMVLTKITEKILL